MAHTGACMTGQTRLSSDVALPCCRSWDCVHVRHLHLRGDVNVAVKLLAHCETVTVLVDGSCLLDLGPDHPPSPYGLLRLLKGTRLRQLTVELLNPVRWG